MDRRQFLAGMAMGAGTLLLPESLRAAEPDKEINSRLLEIAKVLRTYPEIWEVEESLQKDPNGGVVSLPMWHYQVGLRKDEYACVERSQKEKYSLMKRAMDDPVIRLHQSVEESYVDGSVEKQLAANIDVMRYHVRIQLSRSVPGVGTFVEPSKEMVEREMKSLKYLEKPIPRRVYVPMADGTVKEQEIEISALAGVRADAVLHHQKGLKIIAGDSAELLAKAREVLLKGTQEEIDEWAFRKRDAHVFDVMSTMREKIRYVSFGFGHDFREEAKRRNVSLLTVKTKVFEPKQQQEFIPLEDFFPR